MPRQASHEDNAAPSLSANDLFAKNRLEYGDQYASHLFDQYKLYVASHQDISQRRDGANKFFLSVNTALVGVLGVWKSSEPSNLLITAVCVAGAASCVYWCMALSSYQRMNSAKFKVIHAIEARLPLAIFKAEWAVLGWGRSRLFKPFSEIERAMPVVFILLYVIIALAGLRALLS
jgi:hypothetical protein